MRSGNPLGHHCQRVIVLALIFESLLANEDSMGVFAPVPDQSRAGLQHDTGLEGNAGFPQGYGQVLQAAPQHPARCAMGALLQLMGEASISKSRLRPKGGSVRCNRHQASRRSWVDRSLSSAISTPNLARCCLPARSLPSPRPRMGDGPPVRWRAEALLMGTVIGLSVRGCGRRPRAPLWPRQS
jgi:hypothetical protein